MSERTEQFHSLLHEVKDRPHEDAPRLILADFLQDMGDIRGEFIHLQIRRAQLPEDDPEAVALHRQELKILKHHALDWLGPFADLASSWEFQRGFIRLTVRGNRLRDGHEHLEHAQFHWVEGLTLSELSDLGYLRSLPPALAGELTILDLSDNLHLNLRPLLHESIAAVRMLHLARAFLGDRQVETLAGCPYLRDLRVLDLHGNRIRDEGAVALAGSSHLTNLHLLDVRDNAFTSGGEKALRDVFGDRVKMSLREDWR